MKLLTLVATLLLLVLLGSDASAQNEASKDAARRLAQAFKTKNLARLDREGMRKGTVRVLITHSLADETEDKTFTSFAAADRWLASGGRGIPGRNISDLERCTSRKCYFRERGLLHNNLYLTSIDYVRSGDRIFIKVIHILDGD